MGIECAQNPYRIFKRSISSREKEKIVYFTFSRAPKGMKTFEVFVISARNFFHYLLENRQAKKKKNQNQELHRSREKLK